MAEASCSLAFLAFRVCSGDAGHQSRGYPPGETGLQSCGYPVFSVRTIFLQAFRSLSKGPTIGEVKLSTGFRAVVTALINSLTQKIVWILGFIFLLVLASALFLKLRSNLLLALAST